MKKLILIFMTCIAFSYMLKAQPNDIRMYDIYTPVGNPVVTWITEEEDDYTRWSWDVHYTNMYPDATPIIYV